MERTIGTVHPSYLLRLRDPSRKETEYDAFVAEIKWAAGRQTHDGASRRNAVRWPLLMAEGLPFPKFW